MMPRRVKKRRRLDDDSFEEYLDYVFPKDDEGAAKLGRLMEMAEKWKREKAKEEEEKTKAAAAAAAAAADAAAAENGSGE
jgi:uncharacterized protein (DUF3820 family)